MLEHVLAVAQPFVRVAVEAVDLFHRGDRIEDVLRKRVTRPRANETMGQLRRERHHMGGQIGDRSLVEGALREGGEEDRVAAFQQEPLEVGEQRMRVVADGLRGEIERDRVFGRKARS
jgi:hypothetical protein